MFSTEKNSFLRILDAAANRASEGLRVVEDVARMHLDDRHLTESLKILRHELAKVVKTLLPPSGIRARDTTGDVGCRLTTDHEHQRGNVSNQSESPATNSSSSANASVATTGGMQAVVQANFKRAQQAIRSIEEVAKNLQTLAPAKSASSISLQPLANLSERRSQHDSPLTSVLVEQLRYQTYTLEKAMLVSLGVGWTGAVFPANSIYVLVDGIDLKLHCPAESEVTDIASLADSKFARSIRSLVKANIDFIQLRDKQLTDRQCLTAGRLIREYVNGTSTRLIMNDRADLALACHAHGVHVGQDEMPVADVRAIVGHERLVGVSTHSLEQAIDAARQGADYIGIGPVFPSTTKSFKAHLGCDHLREIQQAMSLPAFAIGGIHLENVKQVVAAGCNRVAVSGMFRDLAGEPTEAFMNAAVNLRKSLQHGDARP